MTIKSGLFIEGVEVTDEHIGKEINIGEDVWDLSTDYKCVITNVDESYSPVRIDNIGDDGDCVEYNWVELDDQKEILHWKWVDRSMVLPPKPTQPSSKQQRQKLAKQLKFAIEEVKKQLEELGEYGMIVEGVDIGDVKIKFQPPMEEY